MFKKSLLALAMVGASTSALAVTTSISTTAGTAAAPGAVTTTTANISVEGMVANTGSVYADTNVTLSLNAQYTVGDTVTFNISGSEFADTNYTLVEVNAVNGTNVVIAAPSATFGFLNATANELSFRVTATGTTTVGKFYQLRAAGAANGSSTIGVSIKLADLADKAKADITATAKTSTGIVIDSAATTAANTATAFVGAQQFKLTPTAANGTVDVAQLRTGFVKNAGGVEQVPAPTFTFTDNSVAGWIQAIADDNFELTLNGDFTGVDSINVGAAATDKFTVSGNTATLKGATALTGKTINFVMPAAAKRVALTAPQSITFTAVVKEGTSKATTVADKALVSTWSLNGDSEYSEFVPFQEDFARAITVTNNGTVEGDIMAEIFAGGKMVAAKKVGTASKYTVTDVSAAVDALAKENSVTGYAGVRITTNAPASNIDVSTIYYSKADKDRVKVN
ncbi:hypothetical protein [Pseudoalteromonas sp. S16_S37]|uniref:hypothetical protein n=1 Tax=Pseudoalteromonas sp. S16_S37 TaxID=2720228 RepID=UPI00167FF36F|nr:hypothetical protein [Pseudoalteromonas sp. S16_S37]MBD1580970.1 hypothetical protein [Pseudoalteromonas sp. S16_S37]